MEVVSPPKCSTHCCQVTRKTSILAVVAEQRRYKLPGPGSMKGGSGPNMFAYISIFAGSPLLEEGGGEGPKSALGDLGCLQQTHCSYKIHWNELHSCIVCVSCVLSG